MHWRLSSADWQLVYKGTRGTAQSLLLAIAGTASASGQNGRGYRLSEALAVPVILPKPLADQLCRLYRVGDRVLGEPAPPS